MTDRISIDRYVHVASAVAGGTGGGARPGDLPPLPVGLVYLTGEDGFVLTGEDGAFLVGSADA